MGGRTGEGERDDDDDEEEEEEDEEEVDEIGSVPKAFDRGHGGVCFDFIWNLTGDLAFGFNMGRRGDFAFSLAGDLALTGLAFFGFGEFDLFLVGDLEFELDLLDHLVFLLTMGDLDLLCLRFTGDLDFRGDLDLLADLDLDLFGDRDLLGDLDLLDLAPEFLPRAQPCLGDRDLLFRVSESDLILGGLLSLFL